jgi:hypothetical protein
MGTRSYRKMFLESTERVISNAKLGTPLMRDKRLTRKRKIK